MAIRISEKIMKLGLGQKDALAFRKSFEEKHFSEDSNEKEYLLMIIELEEQFQDLCDAYEKFFKNIDSMEPRGDHLEFQKKLNSVKVLPCVSISGRVRLRGIMEEYRQAKDSWQEQIKKNNQLNSTAIRIKNRLAKERQKKYREDAEQLEGTLLDNLYNSLVHTAQIDVSKLCRNKFDQIMRIKVRELYKRVGSKVACEIVIKDGKLGLVPKTETTETEIRA